MAKYWLVIEEDIEKTRIAWWPLDSVTLKEAEVEAKNIIFEHGDEQAEEAFDRGKKRPIQAAFLFEQVTDMILIANQSAENEAAKRRTRERTRKEQHIRFLKESAERIQRELDGVETDPVVDNITAAYERLAPAPHADLLTPSHARVGAIRKVGDPGDAE